jgi:hypothetical protein
MNTHRKEGLAAAVAAVLSLSSVQADAAGPDLTGFYVGGSGGQSTVELDGHANGRHFSDSNSETGYKIFGGYMFNQYFGLEASYVNFGSPKDNFGFDGGEGVFNVKVDGNASGHTLEAIFAYPLGPVDVFGKIGAISFNGSAKAQGSDAFGNTFNAKVDFNSNDPVFGAGVMYKIGHFHVRAEGEYYDVSDAGNLYLVTVGAQYDF